MKYVLLFTCLSLLFPMASSAGNMESLIKKDLKAAAPVYPKVKVGDFEALCKTALTGDKAAQQQLVDLQRKYIQSVYKPLKPLGGLLVSVRKPKKNYEAEKNNYAVNLDTFFDETANDVSVRKKHFEVKTKTGSVYSISFPKYHPADDSVEVKTDNGSQWIPLADLTEIDSRFIKNALADEQFESSSDFEISTSDIRMDDISKDKQRGHVDHINRETGERVVGSYESSSMDEVVRTIVLENKGNFPLDNLVIEYQSFVKQTLLGLPDDTPKDFCCVGCVEVKSLAAGERKEITLNLPATVDAKMESITTGDYVYSVAIPSGRNKKSKGRMNGIRVKVHRFTPYGERLTREYESSGVPSREWNCVVPVGADVR